MDSLRVATTVATLTGTCLKTAMTIDGLRPKFPGATSTISAICRECAGVSAYLTDIQSSVLQGTAKGTQYDFHAAFDTSLVGCMVIFSCLEQAIKATSLEHNSASDISGNMKSKNKLDEDQLGAYLSRIQDQKAAMALLVQLLNMKANDKMKLMIQENASLLGRIKSTTQLLRDANPHLSVQKSLFEVPVTSASTERFEKREDPEPKTGKPLVDTRSYQRSKAMSQIKAAIASVPHEIPPEGDLIDFSEENSGPVTRSPRPSPLESMWKMSDSLATNSNEIPSSHQKSISNDSAFHTVRGTSARNQTKAYEKSHKTTPQGGNKGAHSPNNVNEDSPSNFTAKHSLPPALSSKLIRFISPCDHQQAKSVAFTNTNLFPITYKVSVTRPQSYAVRPNFGTILPEQTIDVQFILTETLVGSEEEVKRRDKFRIQSVPVEDVAHGSMFDWKTDKVGARIEELKIKAEIVMREERSMS